MFKNKRKKGLPYSSAFDTTDDPYNQDVPVMTLHSDGIPGRKIVVDLESKDMQAHWQTHEQKLWFVIIVCAMYFLFVLITY